MLAFCKIELCLSWCWRGLGMVAGRNITKTRLYNFDPLKPYFYTVKLGFRGVYVIFLIFAQKHRLWVYIIFLISAQNIDCGYSLEPPRRGNKKNNVYPCKPQFYYIKVGFKGVCFRVYILLLLLPENLPEKSYLPENFSFWKLLLPEKLPEKSFLPENFSFWRWNFLFIENRRVLVICSSANYTAVKWRVQWNRDSCFCTDMCPFFPTFFSLFERK